MFAGVSRSVHGAVNCRGLTADVFHDVDLAAGGPAHRANVVTEHPEGGPDTLSERNLNACLESAITLAEESLRLQPRRGVVALDAVRAGEALASGFDDQISLLKV